MKLTMPIYNQPVQFEMPSLKPVQHTIATYFDEFKVKMGADLLASPDLQAEIQSSLYEEFKEIAEAPTSHQEGEQVIFTFSYKETVGIPYEEIFEMMCRMYGNWLVQAMKKVKPMKDIPYQLEIKLAHVFPYSSTIKFLEN